MDYRSDIWSLGVLIVRLVTLDAPYSTEAGVAMDVLLARIATGELTPTSQADVRIRGQAKPSWDRFRAEAMQVAAECTELRPESRLTAHEILRCLVELRKSTP